MVAFLHCMSLGCLADSDSKGSTGILGMVKQTGNMPDSKRECF
jgi:hypothetical protein